jgi:hypothetical protein
MFKFEGGARGMICRKLWSASTVEKNGTGTRRLLENMLRTNVGNSARIQYGEPKPVTSQATSSLSFLSPLSNFSRSLDGITRHESFLALGYREF